MQVRRDRLRGIAFAKQFPNPQEPTRGLFVAEQIRATRQEVDWRVLAPVPYVPHALAGPLNRPFVKGNDDFEGIPVARPRYPVLPRRLAYRSVAPAMAAAAHGSFNKMVEEVRPHFVHAHALYPSAAAARRLVARHHLPMVVTVHGSDLYSNLVEPAWKRELERVCRAASAIVCVSSGLAIDTIRELGVEEWKVQVIPDTYDDERFRLVEREERLGPLRLVTVGRLVEVKGHDVLIDAVGQLAADGVDLELEVVGSGPLETMLRERAAARGIADRVTFSGILDGDDLAEAMARADLFVLASHREGFGVVLVEALATGLPVVATAVEGPRDIVGEADGVLVPPGDAEAFARGIREALEHRSRWEPAAIASRAQDAFGRAAVGRRLVEVFAVVTAAAAEGTG